MDIRNTKIEFTSLIESANKIKCFADDLSKQFDIIIYTVSDLNVSCNGETCTQFNTQIKSCADELDAMLKDFEEYAEYLLVYEHELSKHENELSALATCLPKDLVKRK